MPTSPRTALVTGAASGIGAALAEELVRRGARVVLADRDLPLAESNAARLRERGGEAFALALDVRDAARFRAVADEARARFGPLDYLFNNAGIGVGGEVSEYDAASWSDVLDVNLNGVIHGIAAVYPEMVARGSGHIVNTASVAGLIPAPGMASYAASKHAVVGLSKALRIEAARRGVRVSALCPGAIRTPIFTYGKYGRVGTGMPPEVTREFWEKLRPMAPDVFARGALDAVERNQGVIVLPRWWRALWWLERASPVLSAALSRRLYESTRAAAFRR
ncbi:MAG: SDR family oxidoreductase [Sandaracinus sp.]|nr:SDR family oxidoreductase [Sandaracinus sp.]MCB9615094.1 SDR family oxidoreductase [Sandaracinus sp.]MCB9634974.1 SDR family oxidoreductase [Sandaracinus sp.]